MFTAGPDCTYLLARHRHPNDTFAVTLTGTDVNIYTNGTVYSLTKQGTHFKVNGQYVNLPYTVDREVTVSIVSYHSRRYIHVDLASGLHLYYDNGIVQLTVSGFYSHQMAGLCGNADYSWTADNEMIMSDMSVASSPQSFVESWNIGSEKCSSLSNVRNMSNADVALDVCVKFFKQMAEVQTGVAGHTHFQNACMFDAKLGRGHKPSVQAYVLAANTAGVVVDGRIRWHSNRVSVEYIVIF